LAGIGHRENWNREAILACASAVREKLVANAGGLPSRFQALHPALPRMADAGAARCGVHAMTLPLTRFVDFFSLASPIMHGFCGALLLTA
jgi:hypothetical protein